MKNLKRIIYIIIVILVSFLYAHIAKNNNIYDRSVDSSEYIATGAVYVGTVEQEFVCEEDTLDGIKLKAQILGDVQNVQVGYSLVDQQTNEKVAEGEIAALDIQSGKFFELSFDTIENTKNKVYRIALENINGAENVGVGYYFQPETEEGASLVISDIDTEGTLILKTVTDRFDMETFIVLIIFILYITVFMKFLYKLFR